MTPGSVVGRPLASIRFPSGTRLPAFLATATLPSAMPLVAMSSKSGGWPSVPGIAMQTGLVEKRESVPRNGATRPA